MRARVLPLLLAVAALVLVPAAESSAASGWNTSLATFYGPGLYGNGTSCGQTLTPDLLGVAHRSLPCGSLVEFEWHGRRVVVPVVDRGPYSAATWDLTAATCRTLSVPGDDRCHTSVIAWRT